MKPPAVESGIQAAAPSLGLDERVRLMRDGVFNNSGLVVAGLIAIFLVPVMLRGLGAELYGLWAATLAVAGIAGLFDFGLSYGATRQVAASLGRNSWGETIQFVRAAGNAYLLIGIAGACVIGAVGFPLSGGLHLSAASRRIAPMVFLLAGATFLTSLMLGFAMSLLRGLRRFDVLNWLAIAATLLRAGGTVVLLEAGAGLIALSLWYLTLTAAAAVAGFALLGRLEPDLHFRLGRLNWKFLRAHLPFGVASQLTAAATRITWQGSPIIVGLVLGTGWVATYSITQKFPLAATAVIWSAAEAFFPAVAQQQSQCGVARKREILEVGTRWMVVLALPACLILWNAAPGILQAWIGEARPEAVLVFRLITAAAFADALGAAAVELLWGSGAIRPLLTVVIGVALASLGLSLALLPRIGIAGAAWGVLLPMALGIGAILRSACRACECTILELVRSSFRGLSIPATIVFAVGFGLPHWVGSGRWLPVGGVALASGTAYAVSLYLGGARPEERRLAREILLLPWGIAAALGRTLRRRLSPPTS